MEEIVRVEQNFYIHTTSPLVDDRTRVLKDGDGFALCDRYGDFQPFGLGRQGLYVDGTRFLSQLQLRVNGNRPHLLTSTVTDDNLLLHVDLTNPDIYKEAGFLIPRGVLHLFRANLLWQNVWYERLRLSNFSQAPTDMMLTFQLDADFVDIFEVRGVNRPQRGQRMTPRLVDKGIVFAYQGLDGILRQTEVACTPTPTKVTEAEIQVEVHLEPREERVVVVTAACQNGSHNPSVLGFDAALAAARERAKGLRTCYCDVITSNQEYNRWLRRSLSDIGMMVTDKPDGSYPYAGVPWFSTVFGRDGLVTAFETLWMNPGIAQGVLRHLAMAQAQETDDTRESDPGKILHEARGGEMAKLGEIPFGLYYGTVDATPLFIVLAGAYFERTGDEAFIQSLWPHIAQAAHWMETFGDPDQDGFIEYQQHSARGLRHQGWKDSPDSVFHANGAAAEGSIALCEVQGYAYAAFLHAANLAERLGRPGATPWRQKAETLRQNFETVFWCPELGTYGLALDGQKKLCRVRTSNAGHTLFSGIASAERAQVLAETLFHDNSFSGWGIRTVASCETVYNPMSYHNGSVWPHDNAMIAYGLAHYGMKDRAIEIMTALFEASQLMDFRRLPELVCGFRRRLNDPPTLYPVACSPQAWASGAACLLTQAFLGLSIDAPHLEVRLRQPRLPHFLKEMAIRNLEVGPMKMNLSIHGPPDDIKVTVHAVEGPYPFVYENRQGEHVIRALPAVTRVKADLSKQQR